MIGGRRVWSEKGLFCKTAYLEKLRPLGRTELAAGGKHAFFRLPSNGRIHVVAAEHQVIPHGDATETGLDFNKGEIRSPATNVDDQHKPDIPIIVTAPREIIERRLRFFEQCEFLNARLPRGRDGQSTRNLIEGSRHSDYHFLFNERRAGMGEIPALDHVP